MVMTRSRYVLSCIMLCLILTACSPFGGTNAGSATPTHAPLHPTPQPSATMTDTCPVALSQSQDCQTPHSLRVAYGIESLFEHGFTGNGQTVVDIASFGAPNLQHDMDVFDRHFGLPPVNLQVISPLQEKEYDPHHDKPGWAEQITLDVQVIHALAPGANIVVLTSPVAEIEGTIGLPEFRQLIQYAIDHHLGTIITNSWGASEATLKDAAGQAEIQKWNTLVQTATTQQGITFFASSGDHGATDLSDINTSNLSPTPTTSFMDDEPWVTSVGDTSLLYRSGGVPNETAWSNSGGGFSAFFPTPDFQKALPASAQLLLQNRRGVPDVSADGDPATEMAIYVNDLWTQIGGTGAPVWAAIGAIANQMAGHPLGFINPGLYKVAMSGLYSQAFHDITSGNNSVNTGSVHVKGYSATAGWDPITGLGSPNAAILLPALIDALKS